MCAQSKASAFNYLKLVASPYSCDVTMALVLSRMICMFLAFSSGLEIVGSNATYLDVCDSKRLQEPRSRSNQTRASGICECISKHLCVCVGEWLNTSARLNVGLQSSSVLLWTF